MVAGLNRSVAHSITAPKLGDRCKNIFGSALISSERTQRASKSPYRVGRRQAPLSRARIMREVYYRNDSLYHALHGYHQVCMAAWYRGWSSIIYRRPSVI